MRVNKCDSCKEQIDKQNGITVFYRYYEIELCPACGSEIVDLLQDKLGLPHEITK